MLPAVHCASDAVPIYFFYKYILRIKLILAAQLRPEIAQIIALSATLQLLRFSRTRLIVLQRHSAICCSFKSEQIICHTEHLSHRTSVIQIACHTDRLSYRSPVAQIACHTDRRSQKAHRAVRWPACLQLLPPPHDPMARISFLSGIPLAAQLKPLKCRNGSMKRLILHALWQFAQNSFGDSFGQQLGWVALAGKACLFTAYISLMWLAECCAARLF